MRQPASIFSSALSARSSSVAPGLATRRRPLGSKVISGLPACCARAASSACPPRRTGGGVLACSMNVASLRHVRTSHTAASTHTTARSPHTNHAVVSLPVSVPANTLDAYQ